MIRLFAWSTIKAVGQSSINSHESNTTKKKKNIDRKDLIFPEPTKLSTEVATELRDAMVAALHAEGLTMDEAKAMVAIWDNLWFTDTGTPVLVILPQSYADEMESLKISPKPTEIERVFVARLELINKAQGQMLTRISDPTSGMDDKIASEKLAALNLGRYSAGGMARSKTLITAQIEKRFSVLEKIRKNQEDSKTASTRQTSHLPRPRKSTATIRDRPNLSPSR
ncbi:MAG: hypothetical protein ABF379_10760 [Akkermansiaceae bacterium]